MGDQVVKYLTEQDVEFLRELRRWHKTLPVNFGKADRFSRTINRAPEVYLAKTVDGQPIPARAGDVCGNANCWLYYLNSDLEPTKVQQDGEDAVINVKNPTLSAVPSDDYFKITRDKFGHWFPDSPSPASGVPFKNVDSSLSIPDGGLMEIVGSSIISGVLHLHVQRPSTTFRRRYLVNNSGGAVAVNGTSPSGSYLDEQSYFLFDDADGSPVLGDQYGAEPGTFKARKGRLGFTFCGMLDMDADFAIGFQKEVEHVFGDVYGADLEQGDSVNMRIWMWINDVWGPSNFAAVAVHDIYLNVDRFVPEGTMGEAHWYGNRWSGSNFYCAVRDVV